MNITRIAFLLLVIIIGYGFYSVAPAATTELVQHAISFVRAVVNR